MKQRLNRFLLLVLVPAIGLSVAGWFYINGGRYVETDNAYVKSRLVHISSDIDGRVTQISAANNHPVKQGELLFQIDPEPAEIDLMGARAEIANVRQRVTSLKSQYLRSQLAIEESQERIRFLRSELKRQEKLLKLGHGLEVDHANATHELEMGRRALALANQSATVVLTELGGDPELPAEKHSLFLTAQAKVNRALHNLKSTKIMAPVDGILSHVTLEAGEYVEAGEPVFSIVETSEIWVEANLKESQLTHLRVGQTATIIVDAYPDEKLVATVTSMSPATGAEFAVLPPQNATGNWVKVVQRIPVRLDIDLSQLKQPLLIGMTSNVTIDTKHERTLPVMIQSVFAAVRED
jgi:membrane fusion protein (multidrug efflux system)